MIEITVVVLSMYNILQRLTPARGKELLCKLQRDQLQAKRLVVVLRLWIYNILQCLSDGARKREGITLQVATGSGQGCLLA
jgi:hypothetical protein